MISRGVGCFFTQRRKGAETQGVVEYFAGVKYLEMIENEIARGVFEASLGLHRKFGPGLFESVYEELLCYELMKRG